MDNCLCDACYRHVDRSANCPAYRKRSWNAIVSNIESSSSKTSESNSNNGSLNELEQASQDQDSNASRNSGLKNTTCLVTGCDQLAAHLLRKKWFSKMINKLVNLPLNLDNRSGGGNTHIPICENHYKNISHMMMCSLCKRKLSNNQIFFITQVSCYIHLWLH